MFGHSEESLVSCRNIAPFQNRQPFPTHALMSPSLFHSFTRLGNNTASLRENLAKSRNICKITQPIILLLLWVNITGHHGSPLFDLGRANRSLLVLLALVLLMLAHNTLTSLCENALLCYKGSLLSISWTRNSAGAPLAARTAAGEPTSA